VSGSYKISEYHGGERENNKKDLLNANDNENDSYSGCQDFVWTARQQKTLADFGICEFDIVPIALTCKKKIKL
jgi:hypothetical protein